MLNSFLLLLVIMNPFAQTLFLSKLMDEVDGRDFRRILLDGGFLTMLICLACAFLGEMLLFDVFQVTLPALRVFGGLINLQLAWNYVLKGPTGVKLFQGDVTELAQDIALPIMVGAGVVWASIRIGRIHPWPTASLIICGGVMFNCLLIEIYRLVIDQSKKRAETVVRKYVGIAMRFNALLIGAVSVQMILGGTMEFFAAGADS